MKTESFIFSDSPTLTNNVTFSDISRQVRHNDGEVPPFSKKGRACLEGNRDIGFHCLKCGYKII